MLGKKQAAPKPTTSPKGSNTTLISTGTKITGDLEFTGHLEVEGQICGNISSAGKGEALVRIMREGRVEGEINVSSMVINGTVTGNVYCSDNLVLAQYANVTGDVHYSSIEMAKGAHVNGSMVYAEKSAPQEAPKVDIKPTAKPVKA